MKILGISAYYHDSAAALIINGEIIAAAQEERFNRIKHFSGFPLEAIRYCLLEANIQLNELDAIVFYDKPFLKFERLLESYYAFAPKGLASFLKAIPIWLNEKLFLKRLLYKGLKEAGMINTKDIKILFTEHHQAHAASAFYPSPFEEAAILTIDGVGEWTTASFGIGLGNKIKLIREMHFPHSVGLLYSAFTYYLGFTVNSGEYKLMGLAPYGNSESIQVNGYIEKIKKHLISIKEDGSIWLNQSYFTYATGLKMTNNRKWKALFGFKKREEGDEILQIHCDLALAIQTITEEIVVKMAKELKKLSGSKNLCLAGGVALNCVANAKLKESGLFENIYVQPAAGDAGSSLGAALATYYQYYGAKRNVNELEDEMKGTYLGPSYSDADVEAICEKYSAVATKYEDFSELTQVIAAEIHKGSAIGWFQGRMEFGPRALGNRSILASPILNDTQEKLNLKIKKREGFRPFAPSILEEDLPLFYESSSKSPYMCFTVRIKDELRTKRPNNFNELEPLKKLNTPRSQLQSVTHIDFSARLQTVNKKQNPRFWDLISAFKAISKIPILVNTSFNVRGEPLVCSPEDAYRCFMNTELDLLVINNRVFIKKLQANWQSKEKWKMNFKSD